MAIKVIRNDQDYATSLNMLEGLMAVSPRVGTPEAEQLEVLSILLEQYEKKRFVMENPDPIDAIRFRMEQADLTPRDLIPFLGSRAKVSEVLSGKRPLTLTMIRALHQGLGIPAEVLMKETNDETQNESIDWDRFPLQEMAARGYFEQVSSYSPNLSGDALVERAESIMRDFMTPLGIQTPSVLPVLFKKTAIQVRSGRHMDRHALAAWTLEVLRRAPIPVAAYNPQSLTPTFLSEVARLSFFEDGPLRAQDFLFRQGISLVILPHLPRTHLDGAAIAVWPDRPVIGLTLRHDRMDNFWFCLLHELWHLRLHLSDAGGEFYDDLDAGADDPREKEADDGAGETLVPQQAWLQSPARLVPSPQAAQRLANELHVHPSVVAGRIRHHNKSFRLLNTLIGQGQVRRLFPEVVWP